ncbi:TetR/AcrR family transcriptional regulator [Pseudoduganella sp. OTU4001]|uniref:TetR/AcrR family transcriptional regulator n=1 Tax=Pseudoduganella sp. OTU4001 TaxID=3043854 RepID=UPI00313ECAD7
MSESGTRERIVEAANDLFYQQGFEQTSFTHIAEAVGITRGNFYYHFKSKDEILDAVISARFSATEAMLERWGQVSGNPEGRLCCFAEILVVNCAKIMGYGCPVGTLSTELATLNHPSRRGADEIFSLFRIWLRRQFELAGRSGDADDLAMHLLSRSQGIATLAHAFQDEEFIRKEVKTMREWIKGVCTCSS